MEALLGDGQYAFVCEEELFDGAFSDRMSAVRRVSLEVRSIERRYSALIFVRFEKSGIELANALT